MSEMDNLETLLKIDIVFINKNSDERLIRKVEEEGVVIYERL